MTNEAQIAVYAAKMRPNTRKERETDLLLLAIAGVPFGLYRLACQLEAAQKAGL